MAFKLFYQPIIGVLVILMMDRLSNGWTLTVSLAFPLPPPAPLDDPLLG